MHELEAHVESSGDTKVMDHNLKAIKSMLSLRGTESDQLYIGIKVRGRGGEDDENQNFN